MSTPERKANGQGNVTVSFRIEELDCADEVLMLRQAFANEPGIGELGFDVIYGRMSVQFDPRLSSPEAIVEKVARLGMRARIWRERLEVADQRSFWQRHGRELAVSFALVWMAVGFGSHWRISGSLTEALGLGPLAEWVPWPSRIAYAFSILAGSCYVLPKAWAALRMRRADMHLLMSVAVVGAVILGKWLEAASVAFLFSLALVLEQWSMGRARRTIAALLDLSPPTAFCIGPDGKLTACAVEEVAVGASIVVRPGERIPLDGLVLKGESWVDQSPITGESLPVEKLPGEGVYAGTINGEAALEVRVTKAAADTTLAHIVHLISEAQAGRAVAEQWVEKFARGYTPAIMSLAFAVAIVPPLVSGVPWASWFYNALVLLVIACPCALVISTPVSIVSALTAAARHGVLIKGGRYLEACADLQSMAIDKTGTLTYGRPVVDEVLPMNGHARDEILRRAAALEFHSSHPIASAILHQARKEGLPADAVESHRLLRGRGAEGVIQGKLFWIGSRRLLQERLGESTEAYEATLRLEDLGRTVVALGDAHHVHGLISVTDKVREEAAATVGQLRAAGVREICMLTGDNERTARQVARLTGVDHYVAEALPEDKVREVGSLRKRHGSVGMIGDGVNDGPAMAASSLAIAMGAIGTDVALETADIALMSDDLSRVPWLVTHARRTLTVIRQNVALALGLKLLFVVLALFGVASLWMAIAADMGASLLVIFNGLRLLQ